MTWASSSEMTNDIAGRCTAERSRMQRKQKSMLQVCKRCFHADTVTRVTYAFCMPSLSSSPLRQRGLCLGVHATPFQGAPSSGESKPGSPFLLVGDPVFSSFHINTFHRRIMSARVPRGAHAVPMPGNEACKAACRCAGSWLRGCALRKAPTVHIDSFAHRRFPPACL